jgi:hypothetical protein
MGKKRKTYKEKLISDLRRKQYKTEGIITPSLPVSTAGETLLQYSNQDVNQNQVKEKPAANLILSRYPYLLKDVSKTGILTAVAIAIQILLFFILKNNILTIPGVSY